MHARRAKIEASAFLEAITLAAEYERDAPAEHIAKLLAFVRVVLHAADAGGNRHKNGFKRVLLRVCDKPLDRVSVRFFFDEHIFRAVGNLFILRFTKKARNVGSERGEYVHQRGDRGGGEIPFELGDESLGQLRSGGQLLLRQTALQAKLLDLDANLHLCLPPLNFEFTVTKRN